MIRPEAASRRVASRMNCSATFTATCSIPSKQIIRSNDPPAKGSSRISPTLNSALSAGHVQHSLAHCAWLAKPVLRYQPLLPGASRAVWPRDQSLEPPWPHPLISKSRIFRMCTFRRHIFSFLVESAQGGFDKLCAFWPKDTPCNSLSLGNRATPDLSQ
jgi:hypothetical protein